MYRPFEVGPSLRDPLFFALFGATGFFFMMTCTTLIRSGRPSNFFGALLVCGTPTLLMIVFTLARYCYLKNHRWTVLGTENKLGLKNWRTDHVILFSDVLVLGRSERLAYSGPRVVGTAYLCQLLVEVEKGTRQFKFEYSVPGDELDPLAPFFRLTMAYLTEKAQLDLSKGRSLQGIDWELTADAIKLGKKRRPVVYPRKDFSAVRVVDQHVTLWRYGQDKPIFKLPSEAPNACILLRLLEQQLQTADAEVPTETAPVAVEPMVAALLPVVKLVPKKSATANSSGLGDMLFERGEVGSPWMFRLVFYPSLSAFITAIILMILARHDRANEETKSIILMMLSVGMIGLIVSGVLYDLREAFQCYMVGVRLQTPWKIQTLSYEEMASFTCKRTDVYQDDYYSHTQVTLKFARESTRQRPIVYEFQIQGRDESIDRLCDHVATILSRRMIGRITTGQTVAWTDKWRLTPTGFSYRESTGFFSKAEWRELPYGDIIDVRFQNGVAYVIGRRTAEFVTQEECSSTNFLPGLFALQHLMASSQGGVHLTTGQYVGLTQRR